MQVRTGTEALLLQLLDDLVGAELVSGNVIQNAEAVAGSGPVSDITRDNPEVLLGQAGICAGWATDGVMLTQFRAVERLPNIVGPAAPPLDSDDPWAWHAMEPLPPHGMRRVRRIDVGPSAADGTAPFDLHFRNTHINPDLGERVVHEYSGHGRFDTVAGAVTAIRGVGRRPAVGRVPRCGQRPTDRGRSHPHTPRTWFGSTSPASRRAPTSTTCSDRSPTSDRCSPNLGRPNSRVRPLGVRSIGGEMHRCRNAAWVLGVAVLAIALVVSCTPPPAAPPPTTVVDDVPYRIIGGVEQVYVVGPTRATPSS